MFKAILKLFKTVVIKIKIINTDIYINKLLLQVMLNTNIKILHIHIQIVKSKIFLFKMHIYMHTYIASFFFLINTLKTTFHLKLFQKNFKCIDRNDNLILNKLL